ncbi:rhodanese-like domain-containing protein [Chitinophaga ginsengisegetis]|uniref:rhodanese-like domain-containing protein n=1 Tax=Chitinophaga ginsengisegetis TaxID=393003 RepID=UPI000DB93938|nr:rhodanese-like domain-containing protein [Chitinophaga ginsengisegetis]MDR6565238.1 rhodanese-related sulfurtransferase [Chitinophaga ginsengisegetis]MDR6644965.1 rhodanese-related sulfurtransferase [Chitinophaga ginsengisegetis]MDR6652443.1 rhodanese-related sulfurtransferase [Chitinophaga ginsengisegetis]
MGRVFLAIMLMLTGITAMAQQQQAVDAAEFDKDIQQPGVQVFDVRTAGEFSTGHLPHALQADYTKKEEFKDRVQYLDKKKPVYIYCLSGGRSAAAAKWMRENGFANVVELDGGINAWKRAGKQLEGVAEKKPQLSVADYNKAVQAKGYVLTDVGAAWCPPCKQMEPVLEKFFQKHPQVKKVAVDGGNDQDVMKSVDATKLPTFIFYKDGKEVARKQGVMELAELEKLAGL